jgi:predicted RND superfamily exporter protein
MVKLGIGVRVAALPVIALGVGIGIDYAVRADRDAGQESPGLPLEQAYAAALSFTGRVVAGRCDAGAGWSWGLSPIEFQADMAS